MLPGASESDVCNAIDRWHFAGGYTRKPGRLCFDCRYGPEEKRAFVLSNNDSCIVLYSDDIQGEPKMRHALSEFPAVFQLWAIDEGWGYRLEEYGRLTTSYCSKRGLEEADEAPAKSNGDLTRLSALFNSPGVLTNLKKIESGFYLSNGKRCWEFANTLQILAAVLSFHDVDVANAGIHERRQIQGWTIQMLAYQKPTENGTTGKTNGGLHFASLTTEEKTEVEKIRKRARWMMWFLSPLAIVMGWILLAVIALVVLLGAIPGLRRAISGNAGRFVEDFIKDLHEAEPKRILIQGNVVANQRHGVSVCVEPPAQALSELLPRKGGFDDELVFDIKCGEIFLICEAFPITKAPKWKGIETLEERTITGTQSRIDFQKRRTTITKQSGVQYRSGFQYHWTLNTSELVYRFFSAAKRDLTPDQLEILERIVCSFKTAQP